MWKKVLFMTFGAAIIATYAASTWFGWEFANAGKNSRIGAPFFYGGGFRGGK